MAHISKVGIPLCLTIWFAGALVGFNQLDGYANTPGLKGKNANVWPRGTILNPDLKKPTFVMFLHPHCPCSGASVHSLFDVMRENGSRAKYYVVFVRPRGVAPQWEQSETYKKCKQNAEITTIVDDGGIEAAKFGALTSGQTYIYCSKLELTFSGGITSARGMEEVGPERQLIVKALNGQNARAQHSAVFGCSLQ